MVEETSGNFYDFAFGFCTGVILALVFLGIVLSVDTNPKREAALPQHCKVGQQILMTTAPQVELYVCESRWVRK